MTGTSRPGKAQREPDQVKAGGRNGLNMAPELPSERPLRVLDRDAWPAFFGLG